MCVCARVVYIHVVCIFHAQILGTSAAADCRFFRITSGGYSPNVVPG